MKECVELAWVTFCQFFILLCSCQFKVVAFSLAVAALSKMLGVNVSSCQRWAFSSSSLFLNKLRIVWFLDFVSFLPFTKMTHHHHLSSLSMLSLSLPSSIFMYSNNAPQFRLTFSHTCTGVYSCYMRRKMMLFTISCSPFNTNVTTTTVSSYYAQPRVCFIMMYNTPGIFLSMDE